MSDTWGMEFQLGAEVPAVRGRGFWWRMMGRVTFLTGDAMSPETSQFLSQTAVAYPS
jgi:hypothetical protein